MKFVGFVFTLFAFANSAQAQEIAVCGESKGYGYYPSVGMTATEPSKWGEDGISDGNLTLTMIAPDQYDILFSDSTGRVVSTVQDNGLVYKVGQTEISIALIVITPLIMVTYQFLQTTTGPEVVWTDIKFATFIVKAGVFRAQCTFLNLPK